MEGLRTLPSQPQGRLTYSPLPLCPPHGPSTAAPCSPQLPFCNQLTRRDTPFCFTATPGTPSILRLQALARSRLPPATLIPHLSSTLPP